MFFIGIFGFDAKHKEIKEVNNVLCKNCNEETTAILSKAYKCFHFFYIPIIKYNKMYFIKCDGCQSIHKIKEELGMALERGEERNITIWDLDLLSRPDNLGKNYVSICASCNSEVKKEYKFCPNCGNNMSIKK